MLSSSNQHEFLCLDPPTDTVSCLRWNPHLSREHQFLATSWDSSLRVYDILTLLGGVAQKARIQTPDPCLSIALNSNLDCCVGSVTGAIYYVDLESGRISEIGQHADAVKDLYQVEMDFFLSVSYDKTIKLWDRRTPREIGVLKFPEKILCADYEPISRRIALGLSNEKVFLGSLPELSNSLGREITHFSASPLGPNTTISAISLSKDDPRVAIASLEGRSNLSKIRQRPDGNLDIGDSLITFRAHRLETGPGISSVPIMYPINDIQFFPGLENKFFTAGGEGNLFLWDLVRKDKVSMASPGVIPITKAAFSPDGKYVAYAKGYDWAKGIQGDNSYPTSIGLHEITRQDLDNNGR